MAKIENYVCDSKNCKNLRAGDRSLMIFSHTTPDASGNGHETWRACADLCPKHLLQFTQYLIGLIEDKRIPKKLTDVYDTLVIMSELR